MTNLTTTGGSRGDCIRLGRMTYYGYHGVYPEENKLGQRYEVEIDLYLDLRQAGEEDDLGFTVNYAEVARKVAEIVEGPPVKLIETLAERVATMVLHTYTRVKSVGVRVTKPHPPVPLAMTGVTVDIYRERG